MYVFTYVCTNVCVNCYFSQTNIHFLSLSLALLLPFDKEHFKILNTDPLRTHLIFYSNIFPIPLKLYSIFILFRWRYTNYFWFKFLEWKKSACAQSPFFRHSNYPYKYVSESQTQRIHLYTPFLLVIPKHAKSTYQIVANLFFLHTSNWPFCT